MAARLAAATGPVTVVVPKNGWSALDVDGGPFWDPEADTALVKALKDGLKGAKVELVEVEGVAAKGSSVLPAPKLFVHPFPELDITESNECGIPRTFICTLSEEDLIFDGSSASEDWKHSISVLDISRMSGS